MKNLKTFILSFITRNGVTVLNSVIYAKNRQEAIDEISEESHVILSCVTIKNKAE